MEIIDLQGQPLNLDLTLACGQAFRWRRRSDGVWSGVVRDKLVELVVKDSHLHWRTNPLGDKALVQDYLRLSDDVNSIYSTLSEKDPHLAELIKEYRGMRFLRQDPTETLFSFVCSAANSIPRIMTAIEGLSIAYGRLVCESGGVCYYTFPTVEALASADPTELAQTESLGFRGPNIRTVAQQLQDYGPDWLISLRKASYQEAKHALVGLRGVGRKIADCVCLFSLDKDEAVPVDTHVRQLAHRLFLPEMKAKTITDAVYRTISDEFWKRYGQYAGWAQQFLFYEDLLRTRELGRGL